MRRSVAVLALLVLVATTPQLASAGPTAPTAFPGRNGRIVFTALPRPGAHDTEIYSIRPDGSLLRRLTYTHTDEYFPAVSPDGKWIAFTRSRGSNGLPHNDLFIMNRRGEDQQQLIRDRASEYDPTWSPDGTKIAYGRNQYSGGADIWVIDVATGDSTLMTRPGCTKWNPAWRPDGSQIAFVTCTKEGFVIKTVDVQWSPFGPGETNWVLVKKGVTNNSPDWTPDGAALVYSRARSGEHSDLYIRYVSGPYAGTKQRLTHTPRYDDDMPSVSPTGNRIVWVRGHHGDRHPKTQLWSMRIGVGTAHRVTHQPLHAVQAPSWSPAPR